MIKNLVFDLGGVLVKIALQGYVHRFQWRVLGQEA